MKTTLLIVGGICACSMAFSQQFSLISPTQEHLVIGHQITNYAEAETSINGEVYRDFSKTHKITMKDAGVPELPIFSESVIVPDYGDVSLSVTYDSYTDYTNVLVSPSKGSLKRNVNPESVNYVFGSVYNTDAFFPANLATMDEPYNLRNTRGVAVHVYPFQYNPVAKVLRVYHNVKIHVETDESIVGLNEITWSKPPVDPFQDIYRNHYLNATTVLGKYTPLEEEGQMLIIADDAFLDEIEPLAQWKTQEGIKTTVVGTSTAGTTDVAIKSYVQNFYNTNADLMYLLLVGDHSDVPCHTYGSSGWEELWSDTYYAQLAGGNNDYYPEIFVGRFSGNASDISVMVERTLEYEKNPAAGNWMTKAIGLASDEGAGYGDDGEADWQHARNNRTKLMNYGYTTVYEFYDGSHGGEDASGNPNSAIINPAVNEGIGLFNYTGHGDLTTCITGNYSGSHINSATNNGMYPLVVSVACNNGTFTSGTCISETWTRATNAGTPSGAIAACGSTILMAWAEPMQTQDEMTDIIAETYANNRKATLGGIFYNAQMSMLEEYGASATAKEVMQTWVMFGDPSTLFRNKETMNMTVSHVGNVPMGTSNVNITCNTDGATIAIVQNGVLLGKGVVSGGTVNISFPALTSNLPLTVTGTKQNYRPYVGTITVANGPAGVNEALLGLIKLYPNPSTNHVTISWDNSIQPDRISIQSISGQEVYSTNQLQGNTLSIETDQIASGVYLVSVSANGAVSTQRLIVQ